MTLVPAFSCPFVPAVLVRASQEKGLFHFEFVINASER